MRAVEPLGPIQLPDGRELALNVPRALAPREAAPYAARFHLSKSDLEERAARARSRGVVLSMARARGTALRPKVACPASLRAAEQAPAPHLRAWRDPAIML